MIGTHSNLGVEQLEHPLEVPAVEEIVKAPYERHVLLGYRPRSIRFTARPGAGGSR
jgi:hypothetical protein